MTQFCAADSLYFRRSNVSDLSVWPSQRRGLLVVIRLLVRISESSSTSGAAFTSNSRPSELAVANCAPGCRQRALREAGACCTRLLGGARQTPHPLHCADPPACAAGCRRSIRRGTSPSTTGRSCAAWLRVRRRKIGRERQSRVLTPRASSSRNPSRMVFRS